MTNTATKAKLFCYIEDGYWQFQEAEYIDEGWYIVEVGIGEWELWECPLCNNPWLDSTHPTFSEAYDRALKLT